MKKTVKFMDWWMGKSRALKICSRRTYQLIWDRRMKDALPSLEKDIRIYEGRVRELNNLAYDLKMFIAATPKK